MAQGDSKMKGAINASASVSDHWTKELDGITPSGATKSLKGRVTSMVARRSAASTFDFASCRWLVGLAASAMWYLAPFIRNEITKRFTASLEICSKDDVYDWMKYWMEEQVLECPHRTVEIHIDTEEDDFFRQRQTIFFPSLGTHMLKWGGRYLWITRERNPAVDLSNGGWMESMTLTTLRVPFWNTFHQIDQYLRGVIVEAKATAARHDDSRTSIYISEHGGWSRFGAPRKARRLESVVLDDGVAEGVVNDMRRFMESAQWYSDRGIPYRRGYLLYGSPGCGKSSFIRAIAGHFGMGICICSLNSPDLTDETLNQSLNDARANSIILLEDIDAVFDVSNSGRDKDSAGRVSFSGLLNALDGVAAQEGRVLFMTTNRHGKLDEALIRKGRVDLQVNIDLASFSQVERMFRQFFPSHPATLEEVKESMGGEERWFNMAELQSCLMDNRDQHQEALGALKSLPRASTALSG